MFWYWHPNQYPPKKGIHFSFSTMNFALRFMRKFKTDPFDHGCKLIWDNFKVIGHHESQWYTIKILNQLVPTKEQYTWLKRCNPNKQENPMTFEEFRRGYYFQESKKDNKGRTVWQVFSNDYSNGRGYHATALDKDIIIWTLKQSFNALQNKGNL